MAFTCILSSKHNVLFLVLLCSLCITRVVGQMVIDPTPFKVGIVRDLQLRYPLYSLLLRLVALSNINPRSPLTLRRSHSPLTPYPALRYSRGDQDIYEGVLWWQQWIMAQGGLKYPLFLPFFILSTMSQQICSRSSLSPLFPYLLY